MEQSRSANQGKRQGLDFLRRLVVQSDVHVAPLTRDPNSSVERGNDLKFAGAAHEKRLGRGRSKRLLRGREDGLPEERIYFDVAVKMSDGLDR